jgi:transcriptional regulator with XRE-family HTH domain
MDQSREQSILLEFGKKLKALRLERNLSTRQLALNADLEYGYINELEHGKKNPSVITILSLADGLSVDPCILLPRSR